MWRIYYKQTSDERYDTRMNATAREIITDGGLTIIGEYGGSLIGGPVPELDAEQAFIVEGEKDKVEAAAVVIQHIIKHEVEVTEEH